MISDIFWFIVKCKKTFTTSIHACTNKALKNTPNNSKEERRGFVPMAGVASVCLPTNWAGPSPSRKSLNWLLAPRFTPEKIKLPQKTQNSPLLTLKITNLYTNVSSVLLMAPLSQHMWWIHFAASRRISLALIIYNKKKYLRDCPSDRKHPVLIWLCLSFGFIVASHSPRWLIFKLRARYIRLCLLSVGQHIQKYPQAGMDVSLRTCWHAVITVTLTHFIQDVFVTQSADDE